MTPEEMQKRMEEMRRNPPPLGTYALHLSDFKKVDGIMLPHKIETSLDGEPNEEWTIEKYKVNSSDQGRSLGKEMKTFVATLAFVAAIAALASVAAAQVVPGTGVGSSLRVTVLDQTDAALIIAQVTIADARGVEQTATVDDRGVAVFENLAAGTYQVKATAESFRPLTTPFNVRRGENRTTLRLVLATIEQSVLVEDTSAADRRDNGFTQTLIAGADRLAAGRSGRDGRGACRAWPGRARRFS